MALAARPGRTASVQRRSDVVGSLIDCQILVGYAEQAMRSASCPENAAPVSVALSALGKLRTALRSVAGGLEADA
jgi:hypothetical protein